MTRSVRIIAAVAAVGSLAACFGRLPAREMYRLTPPDTVARDSLGASVMRREGGDVVARPVLQGTLGVVAYETPGLYGESSIVYRIGETEYGNYPSREWALPLGDMLGQLTARLAGRTALTRDAPLFDPPSPRAESYLWRARVREFEEVNRGRALLVSVRIDATIVRARDDSVVWSGTVGRERAVTTGSDMRAIVSAISSLAVDVIDELLGRAERELAGPAVGQRAPADTARRTP